MPEDRPPTGLEATLHIFSRTCDLIETLGTGLITGKNVLPIVWIILVVRMPKEHLSTLFDKLASGGIWAISGWVSAVGIALILGINAALQNRTIRRLSKEANVAKKKQEQGRLDLET